MKEVFDALLKAYGIDERMNEKRLIMQWPTLCGPLIARHTKSLYVRNKVLHVQVDNSVLREELIFSRQKLKEKLNEEMGTEVITDIVIR